MKKIVFFLFCILLFETQSGKDFQSSVQSSVLDIPPPTHSKIYIYIYISFSSIYLIFFNDPIQKKKKKKALAVQDQLQALKFGNSTLNTVVTDIKNLPYWVWIVIAAGLAIVVLSVGCIAITCLIAAIKKRRKDKKRALKQEQKNSKGSKMAKTAAVDASGFRLEPVNPGADHEFFEVMDPFGM